MKWSKNFAAIQTERQKFHEYSNRCAVVVCYNTKRQCVHSAGEPWGHLLATALENSDLITASVVSVGWASMQAIAPAWQHRLRLSTSSHLHASVCGIRCFHRPWSTGTRWLTGFTGDTQLPAVL